MVLRVSLSFAVGTQLVAAALGLVHLLAGGAVAGRHHVNEAIEEIPGVMGTGAGFGVVLDGENRFRGVTKALERTIVEIDVRWLGPDGGEAVCVNCEAMVLAGDLNFAGVEILHGLIAATMAELEFVRLSSQRQAQQLMSQANAEDGQLTAQLFERIDRGCNSGWVARAIGNKQAIGLVVEDGFWGGVVWDDGHVAAALDEVA